MNFIPQIVFIYNKNIILSTLNVKFDYTEKKYLLEIIGNDETPLFKGIPKSETEIKIDSSYEFLTFNYYELDDNNNVGRLFFEESFDIRNNENINKTIHYKPTGLMEQVSFEMDNPKGNIEDIQNHTLMLKQSAFDKKARTYVENKISQIISKHRSLKDDEIAILVKTIYANLYGMGIIQELDDNENISEILINATVYPKFRCRIYYIKTNQSKKLYGKTFQTKEELLNIFSRAISFSKKELNSLENAIIETTRANGDRVNLIIPEASDNYVLNIRKFSNFVPTKENMMEMGTINEEIDLIMKKFVLGKANIGIGGEMGTGKTTFINYLLGYTNPLERKVIISSVKEIDVNTVLKDHDIISLNVNDDKDFTFSRFMKTALRTTADRIIIPESRGEEFKQVYEANLKTKGNMFTAHALNDSSFLDVCADMYMENSNSDALFIKNKIAKSVDVIVIMKKINNMIRIKSISEVVLDENSQFKSLNLLYYWDFEDTKNDLKYKKTNNKISNGLRLRLFEEGVSKEDLISL